MNEDKKHILFALIGLIAVIVTVSLLIGVSAYDHQQDIGRDKFYASHCDGVSKTAVPGDMTTTIRYECSK